MMDWPNSISSRHSNLRLRAEAYASALYYSECSLGGISPHDAAEAEKEARACQSRWWLKGNDPNHPSQEGHGVSKMSISAKKIVLKPNVEADMIGVDGALDDGVDIDQDDQEVPIEDDPNAPIIARDDDLGSSFGTLSNNCSYSHKIFSHVSTPMILDTVHRNSKSMAISAKYSLLPSWLHGQYTSPVITVTTPMVKGQGEGSSEEMLDMYSTYQNQLLAMKPHVTKTPPETAQVTSESDGDDYTIISTLSSDSNTFQTNSFKKRVRDGVSSSLDQTYLDAKIDAAKTELLSRLCDEGNSLAFKAALVSLEELSKLKASYGYKKIRLNLSNPSIHSTSIDGTWLTISPAEYPSVLGKNSDGESLFTLGRMTFDMFEPKDLICTIQQQYNTINDVKSTDLPLHVPKSLRREVAKEQGRNCGGSLKTYNIIASFTIENINGAQPSENATAHAKEPMRGILTNYGYALPDPTNPNRKSIWFTGGTIEPADERQLDDWKKVFGAKNKTKSVSDGKPPTINEVDEAKTLASTMLLGVIHEPMDDKGVLGYQLNRPMGGHGNAYCDVVYMDDDIRVMRGHSGSNYVFRRV